ncbi:hypothetical protein LTR37_007353 [Vermiconidia calcicola]|uniref:Uncharacterized protein n=1 Tax=Vermiconidia calcicola TaxID=1690605 RepID=A0ACC3NE77_9PEZI|nr:hypothetical protein LTR37_007353 [Vermiconidia calcicola]
MARKWELRRRHHLVLPLCTYYKQAVALSVSEDKQKGATRPRQTIRSALHVSQRNGASQLLEYAGAVHAVGSEKETCDLLEHRCRFHRAYHDGYGTAD